MLKPKVWTEKTAEEPKLKQPLMRLSEGSLGIEVWFADEEGGFVAILCRIYNGWMEISGGCEEALSSRGYDTSWGEWSARGKIKVAGYDE